MIESVSGYCLRYQALTSQEAQIMLQRWAKHESNAIIPLNCNFILPRMILHGTMTILQCIPVTCLRGPRYVIYTSRGSTCVEIHVSWK